MGLHRLLSALLWTALLAAGTGLVFIGALYASLPETDGAKQGSIVGVILDPFVWPVALLFVGFGALEAYFLWLVLLRRRSVERCAAVVFALVCAAIVTTTPWWGGRSLVVPFLALPIAAMIARLVPWTLAEEERVDRALRREAPAA